MNQRGFALIAVLWTLAAMALLVGTGLTTVRIAVGTSRNRLILGRSAWAREACAEILAAHLDTADLESGDSLLAGLDTVDLGRGLWCDARMDWPSGKLNLNLASRGSLMEVLRSEVLVTAVLNHRPLPSVDALRRLPGWDPNRMTSWSALLTTYGDGRIDLNHAPGEVLLSLPGMTPDLVDRILGERAMGRHLTSPEAFPGLLTEPQARTFGPSYGAFMTAAITSPETAVALVDGGAHGSLLRARVTMTLSRAGGHWSVLARETE